MVDWTREKVIDAVKDSVTFGDVLAKLGLKCHGRNNDTLKKYLALYQIDFVSKPYLKRNYRTTSLPNDAVFVVNSTTVRSVVRTKILQQGLIEYKCSHCGMLPEWNNKPLSLQLEHINGINNDHRLCNLTFLCPNCHCQTATWAGKTRKRTTCIERKPADDKVNVVKQATLSHLTKEELLELVSKQSFVTVGKMFGISDNAVRRWCKKLDIPMPGRGSRTKQKFGRVAEMD